jgi:hypothetical protein
VPGLPATVGDVQASVRRHRRLALGGRWQVPPVSPCLGRAEAGQRRRCRSGSSAPGLARSNGSLSRDPPIRIAIVSSPLPSSMDSKSTATRSCCSMTTGRWPPALRGDDRDHSMRRRPWPLQRAAGRPVVIRKQRRPSDAHLLPNCLGLTQPWLRAGYGVGRPDHPTPIEPASASA